MNPKPVLRRICLAAAVLGLVVAGAVPPATSPQNESLAQAYKIISSKQFVDLTHSFSPVTPVWKGFGHATFSGAADPETGQPYIIAKDGFDGSDLEITAIMEKRRDGWYWAEFDDDGDPDYSGRPDVCIDCHASGSDFVRAFRLP